MELYQWRVSALETSQRQMEASQEAADLRAAQLQTRLVQASAEIGSLHSALRAGQLRLELATRDSSALTIQLNALRLETNDMQSKYSEVSHSDLHKPLPKPNGPKRKILVVKSW